MTCLFLVSIFVHCFGCSLPQDAIYAHKPNLPDPPAQIASFERERKPLVRRNLLLSIPDPSPFLNWQILIGLFLPPERREGDPTPPLKKSLLKPPPWMDHEEIKTKEKSFPPLKFTHRGFFSRIALTSSFHGRGKFLWRRFIEVDPSFRFPTSPFEGGGGKRGISISSNKIFVPLPLWLARHTHST